MQDGDPEVGKVPVEADRRADGEDAERPAEASQQEENRDAGEPAMADQSAEEASLHHDLDRRPIRGLGGLGCFTMALAAAVAMALLSTGSFFAGVAGVLIIAVAIGVGLWLYNVASVRRK